MKRLAWQIVAAAACAVAGSAQTATALLGVVVDDREGPVAGASVRLLDGDEIVAEAETDSVGLFHFYPPTPARYSVQVVKPGLCLGRESDVHTGGRPLRVKLGTPDGSAKGVPKRINVSSVIQQRRILRALAPEYPRQALAAGLGGTVTVDAVLDVYGVPATVSSGSDRDPLLVNAAIEAARHWRYRPTALNCLPVEVETQMHFDFDASSGKVQL